MGSKKCQVCDEAQSKYKCPSCFIPFCSLVCFKKHKEIPCGKPESEPESEPVSEEKLPPAPALRVEKPIYVDEPGEAVNQSQLESIASSSEILEAIRNKELQKLIYNLDSSLDAENELDKAMEKEEFRIISEKILSIIS
ncbi:zinc finger HIT domain-containing protein 3 [Solanum tuberosum]|uniref:Zinc finger family protein n=1 Tax=Solanum tuberosum TaxID=4113 RepID=M1B6B3_SOLTU|nr:PREDICTED: zinc finger HIT domain-containing protein 3 [Solanum tuberosum]